MPRVYAITRNIRWTASSLSFVTFAQLVFGVYLAIDFVSQPSTCPFVGLRRKSLRQALTPEAAEIPGLPGVDGYRTCAFQRWQTGEVTFLVLSIVYGMFHLPGVFPAEIVSLFGYRFLQRDGTR